MDNPPTPGDNLGTTPDTPVVRLTRGDVPVTYDVDMTTKTLRPAQVAALLGVARQTVHDYAAQGRLEFTRTPGGHRRYPSDQPLLQDALTAQEADQ